MASLGNLDNYLNESGKITDFSWLDIDPKDYDNVPFNSIPEYIAIPKLEEQWKHLKDRQNNPNLVPNVELDYNYKVPNKQDDMQEEVQGLLKHIKKQMMSGKTGKDLLEDISSKSTPKVIRAAFEQIKVILAEQGLLGNVYVDPTVFSKCTEGASFTDKKNKTAKYVKEMPNCSGCSFNKKGHCDIYRKTLASEISYDEKLLNFYSKHFSSLKGKEVNISSKENLKKSFLEKPLKEVKIAEFKPIERPEEKTLEQKEKEYDNQYKALAEELSGIPQDKISKDISNLLVRGYTGKVIKSYIAEKYNQEDLSRYSSVFEKILSKQGSLGKLYIEADLIPHENCAAAKDYVNQNASQVKFIVIKPHHPFCKCHQNNQNNRPWGQKCRNLNKVIIPDIKNIPAQHWFEELNKYPKEVVSKIASIFETDKVKGLRLAFLCGDLVKNGYKTTENYELKSQLDSTEYRPKVSSGLVFSSNKISHALNKGYKLSSIINLGKKAGLSEDKITTKIREALSSIESIKKYQLDIPFELPKKLAVIVSQKDVSIDMKKSSNFKLDSKVDSSNSPIDDMVSMFGLVNSSLEVGSLNKKKPDLEIFGLSEFTID